MPYGSCLHIFPDEDEFGNPIAIEPVILGFTIQNGIGLRVREALHEDYPAVQRSYRIGGGFVAIGTFPRMIYNHIVNNGAGRPALFAEKGGGGYTGTDVDIDEMLLLNGLQVDVFRTDTLRFAHNLFRDNNARIGKAMMISGMDIEVDFTGSHFDVFDCDDFSVTPYWITGNPEVTFNFSGVSGDDCSIDGDIWVAPDGDNYLGAGTPESPFQTINFALSRITGNEMMPRSVILAPGTYSPDLTGEQYPLHLFSGVGILGDMASPSILDADSSATVLLFRDMNIGHAERLVITGGYQNSWVGGGIAMYKSTAFLNHLTVTGNSAVLGGGLFGFASAPIIANTIIWDNSTPQLFFIGSRDPSHPVILYSDIQGGEDDIVFIGDDFIHWLSGNMNQFPQLQNDFTLSPLSPCVDAGIQDAQFDIEEEQFSVYVHPAPFNDLAPDMGALELGGIQPFPPSGDVNGDQNINVVDVVVLVDLILFTEPEPFQLQAGDLDQSGSLDVIDVVLLVDLILYGN